MTPLVVDGDADDMSRVVDHMAASRVVDHTAASRVVDHTAASRVVHQEMASRVVGSELVLEQGMVDTLVVVVQPRR